MSLWVCVLHALSNFICARWVTREHALSFNMSNSGHALMKCSQMAVEVVAVDFASTCRHAGHACCLLWQSGCTVSNNHARSACMYWNPVDRLQLCSSTVACSRHQSILRYTTLPTGVRMSCCLPRACKQLLVGFCIQKLNRHGHKSLLCPKKGLQQLLSRNVQQSGRSRAFQAATQTTS